MIYPHDRHRAEVIVDEGHDPVGATSSGEVAREFTFERLAEAVRIGGQRPRDELDTCPDDLLRQPTQASTRGGGDLDPIRLVGHDGEPNSARISSIVTVRPAATSSADSRISASA